MTPEEKARVKIDQMFEDAGWQVVDRDFYSPSITAAAIREGKTYTACLASYRSLAYTPMKRVLFLVDRNNLGKQAEGELDITWVKQTCDDEDFTLSDLIATMEEKSQNIASAVARLKYLMAGIEE